MVLVRVIRTVKLPLDSRIVWTFFVETCRSKCERLVGPVQPLLVQSRVSIGTFPHLPLDLEPGWQLQCDQAAAHRLCAPRSSVGPTSKFTILFSASCQHQHQQSRGGAGRTTRAALSLGYCAVAARFPFRTLPSPLQARVSFGAAHPPRCVESLLSPRHTHTHSLTDRSSVRPSLTLLSAARGDLPTPANHPTNALPTQYGSDRVRIPEGLVPARRHRSPRSIGPAPGDGRADHEPPSHPVRKPWQQHRKPLFFPPTRRPPHHWEAPAHERAALQTGERQCRPRPPPQEAKRGPDEATDPVVRR